MIDQKIINSRHDFPILNRDDGDAPLIYLDNAATTQKPKTVINAIAQYYQDHNANVHRGVYTMSERSTTMYENARKAVSQFIRARATHEIIFVSGATEALNMMAYCFAYSILKPNDEIIISTLEHHANIVPWQVACERTGAKLKIIPLCEDGTLDLIAYRNLLNERTRLVSVAHISNVLGTLNPIKEIIALAHANGTPVLIDGAQSIARLPIDVQDLDCDFYAFSSHKMYGPTGVGVLYGKSEWLEKLCPYQTGGHMISRVTFDKTVYSGLPDKFEAGTPNIAGVIGLAAAIEYLNTLNMTAIMGYEKSLTEYATQKLSDVPGLRIIGTTPNKMGVISFVMDEIHPHDIATLLDHHGIAIRAGHHCAMPLMEHLNLPATARISFGVYNQINETDRLIDGLEMAKKVFGVSHV